MSLHTWCHQGPCKPSSCAKFTLNSHGNRDATGKQIFCIYVYRVASVMSNTLRLCRLWPARLLCQVGSPGKNTGVYWPILVAISFKSTIFPAALANNSRVPAAARTPVTQAAASPPHLTIIGANPSAPGSLRSNLQWTTQMQRWK